MSILPHTCECYICHREMDDVLREAQSRKNAKTLASLTVKNMTEVSPEEMEALKQAKQHIEKLENAIEACLQADLGAAKSSLAKEMALIGMAARDHKNRNCKNRIEQLENLYRHRHVHSFDGGDLCEECGLDLRDPIHERIK